jgi:hypothetical protein
MPITVRDETANVAILTINNDGTMAFGDGTPINMLTIAGYGIIDSNGHVTHGLGTTAGVPVTGAGNCGIHQSVSIATISGRIPNIQIDTQYPAASYFIDFRSPGDPSSGGTESVTTTPGLCVHMPDPYSGGFSLTNENVGDGYVDDSSSPYYDANLNTAGYAYAWI